VVIDVCKRFEEGQLAMKLAHTVFEEARTLAHLPKEAQQAELKRLLKRHSEKDMLDSEHQVLAAELTAFAAALDTRTAEVGKRGFEQMAEWLLLARFLARGGEE
jgi:CRISPR-associated protein Cmr2